MANEQDLQQADSTLKSADEAWTKARSRIYPGNNPARKMKILAEEYDGANPNSPQHEQYLNYKRQYDEAVANEAAAKQAYEDAQSNYKQVYAAQDGNPAPASESKPTSSPSTPDQSTDSSNSTGNPSASQATNDASGEQAKNYSPSADTGEDPYVSNGQSTVDRADATDPYVSGEDSTIPRQDDGADPYVSNGSTTIDPAEDPFEKARQDAEDEYNKPGPTEADVVDEPQAGGGGGGTKTIEEEDNTPWVTGNRNDPLAYKEIYALNKDLIGKDENRLMPGWVLKMPNGGTYTVVYGDTLTWIAQGRGKGKYSRMVKKEVPDDKPKDTGIQAPKKAKIVKNDFKQKPDWRVRLSLAPHATYLYKAASSPTNILYPLLQTDGVIFPYTPQIQINYTANYDTTDLTHSNYKHYQYKNSEVGTVQITGMFTAQDVNEANYLLAVIHFLRSATKMFYGQDSDPKAGTPPPLLYLSGYGAYQFDNHPLVLTSFNMSLPDDVDYIRAGTFSSYTAAPGAQTEKSTSSSLWDTIKSRLSSSKLNKGGAKDQPVFNSLSNSEATYVPTKLQIALTCAPIVTRNDISNNFSLEKYATGELLRGSKRQTGGGGIW